MRTMNAVHEATSCSVAACAEIVGAKWTAILVHDLSERLRALEHEGIVVRRSYPESPPRVEYELTDKGEALLPIIDQMRKFGRAWLVSEPAQVA
jgi:DNA-binding HxlR family transcriptional regulator